MVRPPTGSGSSENNGITIRCGFGHGWGLLSDAGDRPSGLEAVWDLASDFMYDTARHGIGTRDVQVRLTVSKHPTLADVATAAGQLYAPR